MASNDNTTTPDTSAEPGFALSAPGADAPAEQGGAPAGEPGPDQTPAAPRKRAARRATKKASAPAAEAPSEPVSESSATSETPAEGEAAAAEPAMAKKAARKRVSPRKKAAQPRQAPQPAQEIEPGVAGEAPQAVMTAEAVPLEELTDQGVEEGIEGGTAQPAETQAASEVRPAVPSFSVLFQPPDVSAAKTAPRRRRATAEQTTPAPAEPAEAAERPEPTKPARRAVAEAEPTEREELEAAEEESPRRSRRRRGGKGRRGRGADEGENGSEDTEAAEEEAAEAHEAEEEQTGEEDEGTSRRRRRRRRAGSSAESAEDTGSVSTRVREPRAARDEPVAVKGSTRLEAKKQRRREGREAGRRRTIITEAEFLARREAVDRVMVVRNKDGRTQMGVLEDGVLVEHYIDQATTVSMAGNIYLGRVQNVLPSMEAAFVDIGKGRNAVLYAGEVNWDAAGLESNQPKRIENALSSGQTVLVQVTKDPIGHKGARLTSQISLPGRYLVYVPNSSMTGISRKLPDTERARLKKILREVVPESAGVIVRTAAEGASEAELRADVERLTATWEDIQGRAEAVSSGRAGKSKGRKKNGSTEGSAPSGSAPLLLHGEPDLTVRVIRDVFNEDFKQLTVSGDQAWNEIHGYITSVAPDLADRVSKWTGTEDLFTHYRVDEQLAKAMDRKVWLPSGGSLVIDRTEAMTVVDVNTGKFVGSGGNLEETVTKNNIEAAEEIVRQLRLRDIGGIIVIDFIDMVLESNRELVVRRLLECLGRDRTKHQVAEVTSLGLVQMTRKRVGSGLIEVFGETCEHCNGRGFIIHTEPIDKGSGGGEQVVAAPTGRARKPRRAEAAAAGVEAQPEPVRPSGPTAAQIAAAAHAAALKSSVGPAAEEGVADVEAQDVPEEVVHEVEPEEQTLPVTEHEAARERRGGAFPEDSGPWGGQEAPLVEEGPAAVSVELESEVPEPEPEQAPEAPARPRRRRGRVVAPAGPAVHAAEPATTAPASQPEEKPEPEHKPEPERTAEAEPRPEVRPEPIPVSAQAPARRRRGRVVAPAGPPRATTTPAVAGAGEPGAHDGDGRG
jgi:ribonuclease E